jgi:hypothetical protein
VLDARAGDAAVVLRMPPPIESPPAPLRVARSTLEGRVESARPGDPLDRYEVLLAPVAAPSEPGAAVPRRAPTDAEGRFRFEDLAHGAYRALLLPAWARGGTWPDLAATGLDAPSIPLLHPRVPSGDDTDAEGAGRDEWVLRDRSGAVRCRVLGPAPDGGYLTVEGALLVLRADPSGSRPAGTRPDGESLAGATRLWPPGSTDADGVATIEDVPAGRYTLTLTAGGFRSETGVEVRPETFTEQDVDIGRGGR